MNELARNPVRAMGFRLAGIAGEDLARGASGGERESCSAVCCSIFRMFLHDDQIHALHVHCACTCFSIFQDSSSHSVGSAL